VEVDGSGIGYERRDLERRVGERACMLVHLVQAFAAATTTVYSPEPFVPIRVVATHVQYIHIPSTYTSE